ncbi:MAG: photosystem reaction center subunit H [Burkholderiales bacterium PBB5]|nr:MAG: photosystem reaction center subunit H [Burkholderiales bacterium PBB5]
MLNSISHLDGAAVMASDGEIGHVQQALFDDRGWTIRYLVVRTGSWLTGREVLISPYSVMHPLGQDKQIRVALTRDQVRNSPDVATHLPVSRQQERDVLRYYNYPDYWEGGSLWGMGALPYPPVRVMSAAEREANRDMLARDFQGQDVHLRSTDEVKGYQLLATDESIGAVHDFVFDDESWAMRYLVVDTRVWWPGGRQVLIGVHWADRIDWGQQQVHVRLTREQVKASPEFVDVAAIHRDYELRLHHNYQRQGYWL